MELEFNFNVTEQEANIILNALAKEPFNIVVNVINKVQLQAKEQIDNNKPKVVPE